MFESDDARRLRERQAALIVPAINPPASGTSAQLVVSAADGKTVPYQFYAAHPAVILGDEVEGGGAKFESDSTRTIFVYAYGVSVPKAGSLVVPSHFSYRWASGTESSVPPCDPGMPPFVSLHATLTHYAIPGLSYLGDVPFLATTVVPLVATAGTDTALRLSGVPGAPTADGGIVWRSPCFGFPYGYGISGSYWTSPSLGVFIFHPNYSICFRLELFCANGKLQILVYEIGPNVNIDWSSPVCETYPDTLRWGKFNTTQPSPWNASGGLQWLVVGSRGRLNTWDASYGGNCQNIATTYGLALNWFPETTRFLYNLQPGGTVTPAVSLDFVRNVCGPGVANDALLFKRIQVAP